MIIGLTGETDNRALLYPLIKLLSAKGDVAVITPNSQLRRLIEEPNSDEGSFLNTYVVVTQLSPDEVWQEISQEPADFNHVIYDLQLNVADNVDVYLHVYDYGIDEKEEEFLSMIEGFANIEKVKLSYDGKREKDSGNVRVTSNDYAAINKTEYMKEFVAFNNATVVKALQDTVGDKLGLSSAAITNVLKKARGSSK